MLRRSRARIGSVAVLATLGAMVLSAPPALAAPVAAVATVSNPVQYVGDSAGTTFTFTITNSGTRPLGRVAVTVPGTAWTARTCPSGPTGWSRTLSATGCVFRSAAGSAGDLLPGRSSQLQVKATTAAAPSDRVGSWGVAVQTESPVVTAAAAPTLTGLGAHAFSLEISRVTVRHLAVQVGSACPSADLSAKVGSRITLVVCGTNHATAALALTPGRSAFGGTFVSGGTARTGTIPIGAHAVVVARDDDALVSSGAGTGKTVITSHGSASGQTSPRMPFGGFTATNTPPVASSFSVVGREDTATPVTLTGTDADGDNMAIGIATAPLHGALSSLVPVSCTGVVPRTCTRTVLYTPTPDSNGPDSFSYVVRDTPGDADGATVSISVQPVNDAPTAVALAPSSVAENQVAPATVGTLSTTDVDAGDTFTYTLVSGVGSTDNASFAISGTSLTTAAVLDHEAHPTSSVRIRSTDSFGAFVESAFTVTVTNTNDAPTDLALSNSSVSENQPIGTSVGTLSSTDQDLGDTFTYALVAGTGAGDNALFDVTGSTLTTKAVLDAETRTSYSVRVRTTDSGGLSFEKALAITVVGINEPPTSVSLSNATVAENQPSGTAVGTLSGVDPESDALTFTVDSGPDSTLFTVVGTTLQTTGLLDFETQSSYSISVTAADGHGGTLSVPFTISVTDVNDAPTGIGLSDSSVPENSAAGVTVGVLTAADQDTADTETFSFVAGAGDADNAAFGIVGSHLVTSDPLNYEAKSVYQVRVGVSDGHGGTFEKAFVISVTDVPEAPTSLSLSGGSLPELQPVGTDVGTLSSTDPDLGDTATYSLVAGAGSTDNADFQVVADHLQMGQVTSAGTYSVRVRVTDSALLVLEKAFTVTLTGLNAAPTDIALSSSSVPENQPSGTTVGTLTATDADAGDSHTFAVTGGADQGSFTVVGASLQTTASFDFETKSSYAITVTTDDGHGGTFAKDFTITVTNVNDAPTDLAVSPSHVSENLPSGTTVGSFSGTDQDVPADTLTFALVAGTGSTDNASFTIAAGALKTAASFDFETKAAYSIRVQVSDGHGGTFQKALTITVDDANDPPTTSDLSLTGASSAVGNTVLVLDDPTDAAPNPSAPHKTVSADLLSLASDQDAGASLSLVAGTVATTHGGVATIEADGDVTVSPKAGLCSGSDSFPFTVTDGTATVVGTVTFAVLPCVWYVDPSAAPGGTGTSDVPFTSLAPLNGASDADSAGDTLFVRAGTYTGGLALESNEKLYSQSSGLTVPDGGAGTTSLVAGSGSNPVIAGGVVLSSGNTVQGIDFGTTSGFALSGSGVGSATVDTVTAGVISNPSGGALSIGGSGNALALAFDSITSVGGTNGITISSASGSVTGSAGSLSGASGADLAVSSSTLDLTYAGTIDDATGTQVSVANQSSHKVWLKGAIGNSGAGTGGAISLTSNAGATLQLDGSVTASTGGSPAFTATGGGTLAVTGAGSTLTTTTGTPLTITGTTIAAAGVTFRSVSSGAATNGIVLNGTGSGPFSVTGTGTTAGSGGTLVATTSDAVSLTSTGPVSLANASVSGSRGNGIRGTSVNGLALTGVSVTGSGDSSSESGLNLTNLTGSATWTNLSVTGSALDDVVIDNATGTLSSLTVSGASHFDSVSSATGANGFLVNVHGTAALTSGSITGATFANNYPARGLTVQAQETGTIGGFTTSASSFTNNGLQASFEQSGSANLTFALTGNTPMTMPNTLSGTSHAVNVFSSSQSTAGTIRGRIQGNTIGTAATSGSGSPIGSGIRALIQGRTVATLLIDSNAIRQTPLARGIDVQVLGPLDSGVPSGPTDITVTNNTVNTDDTSGFPTAAIYIAADSQGGGAVVTRTDIHGNTVPVGTAFDATSAFLELDKPVANSVCQLVGTGATAAARLATTNTGSTSAASGCTLIAGPIATPP